MTKNEEQWKNILIFVGIKKKATSRHRAEPIYNKLNQNAN